MAVQFREFELMCLSDLARTLNYDDKWKPLYKTWLKKEYSEIINYDIVKIWVRNVLERKHFLDIDSVLYTNTNHFPKNIQKDIIYTIKNYVLRFLV